MYIYMYLYVCKHAHAGLCAQTFSLQNPTGFYNLDLSSQADREVAIRLRGLKMVRLRVYMCVNRCVYLYISI